MKIQATTLYVTLETKFYSTGGREGSSVTVQRFRGFFQEGNFLPTKLLATNTSNLAFQVFQRWWSLLIAAKDDNNNNNDNSNKNTN